MNTKTRFVLILTLTLLGGAALAAVAWATPGNAPLAQGGSPAVVAYQGEVRVGGDPYTGSGYFKFAVVNADGSVTYWSNDGTSTVSDAPTAAVQLAVSEGLFGVLLGDTTLGGMTQALTAGVFSQPDRYLRVWFSDDGSDFDQLSPDTRIAAVPYALQAQEAADAGTVDGYEGAALEESAEIDADIAAHTAITDAHHARYTDGEAWAAVLANDGAGSGLDADTVDGLHANELGTHYQNVVVVAKSGGDYTSVQAAIDSITGAAAANPYLVWVAPGVYSETVTMMPYVHLQGAGQEATVITSVISNSSFPPTQATLTLTSNVSLCDLTVGNGGAGNQNAALLATAGVTRALAADVTARAQGGGSNNYAIFLTGSETGITLQQVTALAESGSYNYGLYNYDAAAAVLHGGSFTGRGGIVAYGIRSAGSATLEAESVTALAENGNYNYGLINRVGAAAALRGGSFTARGGTDAWGIYNHGSGTMLDAESVTALGENASNNYGLLNSYGAAAALRGGSFTARGGTDAWGIHNDGSGTTLDAESVTALGENASNNYGLYNESGAAAALRGGSFTARGGTDAYGIDNYGSSTALDTESVTALGENGSSNNYGLYNESGAAAALRGGSFTGRGGTVTWGIRNYGGGTTLETESVTALGENGSSSNLGLDNDGGAAAALRGGSFTGRGGTVAWGILNDGSATANVTQSVLEGTAYSVYCSSGSVTISNSRLVGGAVGGTVTCVAVSRGGTFNANGCP